MLYKDRKVGIPALLEYVNKNPNSRISNLAAIELRKLGVQL
jgi:hypothetical protein